MLNFISTRQWPLRFCALLVLLVVCQGILKTASALEDEQLEEITVFGRGESLLGLAASASEGVVGGADLTVRPLLRVAEMLEVVPGLIAAQHSGSGKANQYFLRGINLDHGTDFTTYIDDVPMNLRTHGHGQGYLDVNGLIPESVDHIEYHKGTYSAGTGDFSMAGSAFVTTVSNLEPFIAAEIGQYGWRRVTSGGSMTAGDGILTLMGNWKTYDGPWELEEDLQHVSGWGKYTKSLETANFELSVSGYHGTWLPSEQIPERAIGSPVCEDEFCVLDPSATGKTLRWIVTARLLGEDWRATLYGQYYDWHMSSNPTYDFQINQFDRRWIYGGRYEREFTVNPALSFTMGAEGRYDDIGNVGVEHTNAGVFVAPISRHAVEELSAAVYSEAVWSPLTGMRLIGGLRGDWYDFDVAAKFAGLDTGNKTDFLLSPKFGIAYTLTDHIELYGNWGRGFHSNDARGVVNTATPIPGIGEGTGYEGGARFETGSFRLTAAYWWLSLDSELKFVGDSNSVEPGAATRRRGYEIVGFWRPTDWLALDAVWTGSHARYAGGGPINYVTGAIEQAGEFGISAIQDRWEIGVRLRYLGPYPLTEDNSLRADAETMINMRCAWHFHQFTVSAELLNILDNDGKDIVYYYGANVAGLDPAGMQIDGRMSRAQEPFTIRAGIKYTF